MMVNNTGSWSAGDFITEKSDQRADITAGPDQQANVYQKDRQRGCYVNRVLIITLDPDQEATLYKKNRFSMMLNYTGN